MPLAKDDKSESSVLIYTEDGKVEKSMFTEDEKIKMDELTYIPPPINYDPEDLKNNIDLYSETKESYITEIRKSNFQPLVIIEDFYDPVRVMMIINQDGLVQVLSEETGMQNPYSLNEPSIKKASIALFNGIKSKQSEMDPTTSIETYDGNTRSYFYLTQDRVKVKRTPISPNLNEIEIWKSIRLLKDDWQSAYRYSF